MIGDVHSPVALFVQIVQYSVFPVGSAGARYEVVESPRY